MDTRSLSSLPVTHFLSRQKSGEWAQIVVCKATYVLSPGLASLAPEQEPPNEDDNHWNDDVTRSLYAPSDFVPFKSRADVLLVGSAFAPNLVPVQSVVARLSVARIDKSIVIFGDRVIRDGVQQEPARFSSMPLRYERASGGHGTWNPVGMHARADGQGQVRLPNLQSSAPANRDTNVLANYVGFGPITPNWPGRAARLGANAAFLSDRAWREKPLPEGIDVGFFNAAPPDQQVEELRDDERIVLENLHREHPHLVTMLPGLHPRAFIESAGVLGQEIKMRCDTLWIDTDRSLCTLTWRGFLPLSRADEPGRISIVAEERSQRLSLGDIERLLGLNGARRTTGSTADVDGTLRLGDELRGVDTLQLSGTQQSHASKAGTSAPTWLTSSRTNRDAPTLPPPPPQTSRDVAPPTLQAKPSAPPPPLMAPPADSPWVSGTRPAIAPTLGDLAALKIAPLPRLVDADIASPPTKARVSLSDALELLWLDPKFATKIRKNSIWKKHLPESKPRTSEDENDSETAADRKDAKERRDASWILKNGQAASAKELDDAIEAAMADGIFVPGLVLTGGDIDLQFDESKALEATAAVAAPFAAADKPLKEAVDKANEAPVDRAQREKILARIRETFSQSQRSLPQGYLVSQAERILLEQRHYQKRTLHGQNWIRSLLTVADGANSIPIPAYLPESLAEELPMFQRFRVKLIAELRPAMDQYESHPLALRVVALGRLVTVPKRSAAR